MTTRTRRLTRSRTDRKVLGVAGGLGEYLEIDPVIVRIAFVVLTLTGGAGIVAYGAAWLLVPEADADHESTATDTTPADTSDARRIIGLILLAVAALALVGADLGDGLVLPTLLIGGGVWLLVRGSGAPVPDGEDTAEVDDAEPGAGRPSSPPGPISEAVAPRSSGDVLLDPGGDVATTTTVDTPTPARRRLPITRMTLGALALVVGGLGLVGATDSGLDVTPADVLLIVSAVCGLGLVIGAFAGGARGLLVLAVPCVLLASVAAVIDVPWHRGAGDRLYRPASLEELDTVYRHGFGELTVDLRDLAADDLGDVERIEIQLTAGSVHVLLPDGLDTQGTIDVVAGQVVAPPDVSFMCDPGRRCARDGLDFTAPFIIDGDGDGEVDVTSALALFIDIGFGEVTIR